ncbi:MAG: hypothetical protein HFH68_02065 [Lachnospiraceae bacterium]|nr:hypothetical protein [Lachnospiraceae bacterium]
MFAIREVTGGYDYLVMGMDFQESDGGLYDSKDVSIAEALAIVLGDIISLHSWFQPVEREY